MEVKEKLKLIKEGKLSAEQNIKDFLAKIKKEDKNINSFLQVNEDAVNEAKAVYEKPTVIIAHTIPGKGVSFMERDYKWHGKPPNKEEASRALKELRTLGGRITSEHE